MLLLLHVHFLLLLFHDLVLVVEYELAIHVNTISKGIVELPLINMTV